MGRGKKRKAAQAAAAAAGIVSSGKLGGTVKGDKNEENVGKFKIKYLAEGNSG